MGKIYKYFHKLMKNMSKKATILIKNDYFFRYGDIR